MMQLRHGYTLADLHRLARASASSNRTTAADYRDLIDTAWDAITELLFTATDPPTEHDLLTEGKAAIWRLVKDHRQTYGYRDRQWDAGLASAPNFVKFWHTPQDHGPEEPVVERLAVPQILSALAERERAVLVAVAAARDDYCLAAKALGWSEKLVHYWLGRARRRCADLWHQGEIPHRQRGTLNRRRHRGEVAPCGTMSAAFRHRSRKERLCELCAPLEAEYDRERHARRHENAQPSNGGPMPDPEPHA
jgi:DNA-directed RNA polymerase specialized sigma24 family protein